MRKIQIRWATLITFIILLSGWWYWYEYRPQKIREDCARWMTHIGYGADSNEQKSCEYAGGLNAWKSALDEGYEANN
jgi:hypothetical protein